jgi:integrase
MALIDLYVTHYRPLLLAPGDDTNAYLFPSPFLAGDHLNPGYFAMRIVTTIEQRLGIVMQLHLVRHLIGWILVQESPDHLGTVSAALGHSSLQTTRDFYAEITPDQAGDVIDATLDRKTRGRYTGRRR